MVDTDVTTQGALAQLITQNSSRQRVPDNLPIEHPLTIFSTTAATFGGTITQEVKQQTDIVHSFYAHVRIGALPTGVKWKPNLFARLIRSAKLSIGEQPICSLRAEDTMIKLHMGLLTLPNGTPYSDTLTVNQPPSSEQEFCIPLFMKEDTGLSIPLAAIQYSTIQLELVFNPLSELILPPSDGGPHPPLPPPPSFTCDVRAIGEVYTSQSRRILLTRPQSYSLLTIQSDTIAVSGREEDDTIRVTVNSSHIHTTAFLHLTDEHGLEIPRTCVDTITVQFNDNHRHHLSGYEARHMQRTNIPWHGKDTPTSNNIYTLSYWIGRQFSDGDPRKPLGANFARIENVSYHIKLHTNAPPNVRVTLAHDTQNTLRVESGAGRMIYTNSYSISSPDGVAMMPRVFATAVPSVLIEEGEPCMILQEPIQAGTTIYQCGQCRKPCTQGPLDSWFARGNTTCPHCRAEVAGTFTIGPAAFTGAVVSS